MYRFSNIQQKKIVKYFYKSLLLFAKKGLGANVPKDLDINYLYKKHDSHDCDTILIESLANLEWQRTNGTPQ